MSKPNGFDWDERMRQLAARLTAMAERLESLERIADKHNNTLAGILEAIHSHEQRLSRLEDGKRQ